MRGVVRHHAEVPARRLRASRSSSTSGWISSFEKR